jgi:hypothetical protein
MASLLATLPAAAGGIGGIDLRLLAEKRYKHKVNVVKISHCTVETDRSEDRD